MAVIIYSLSQNYAKDVLDFNVKVDKDSDIINYKTVVNCSILDNDQQII